MSTLREAAQQALEALEWLTSAEPGDEPPINAAITALRAALAQQAEPVEPVAHRVVAGALFDFMGWLTTRRERLVLSSTDDAAPAADAVKDFAEMRGLSMNDAQVKEWQHNVTAPHQRKPLTDEEILKAIGWERAEMYMKLTPNFPVAEAKKETLKNARAIERAHGIGEAK